MLTLFYSPHATSIDNEAGRASGHADVPLSELGRQRAVSLGQGYANEALDAVFCSDLQRAYTTVEIAFSGRSLPITRDPRLRECDYGQWTQCPRDQVALEQHIREPYPDGESLVMVAQRVGAFLRDLLRDYEGKRIVVISHAAPKYALEYWAGDRSLEAVVATPWEWLEIPIWRYQFSHPLRVDQR
ncbi:MAG: histidine phosphatase family protein [Chloroflexi bacterium]|nr:histidine phosphatase family protein [Chloroflexota bacterium]